MGLTLFLDDIAFVSTVKADQAYQERASTIMLSPDSQRVGANLEGTSNLTTGSAFATIGNARGGLIQGKLNETKTPIA